MVDYRSLWFGLVSLSRSHTRDVILSLPTTTLTPVDLWRFDVLYVARDDDDDDDNLWK